MTITACQETDTENPNQIIPYQIEGTEEGKDYITDNNGLPLLLLASEIRFDVLTYADELTIEQLENYFYLISETNLNTVEITLPWSMVEPKKDEYDFTVVDAFFDYAVAYDLYLNIQWYGSFVDGESRTVFLPDYITEDTKTYPLLADLYDFGIFGRVRINDWTDEDLLKREGMAVEAVLNRFAERSNDTEQYPLVMFQPGQGLDRFPRWRISQYELEEDGLPMTPGSAWEKVLVYIEFMADIIKTSDYVPLTRVEFTEQNAVVGYVYDVADLENVDIVSPTYLHSISNVKSGVVNFYESFEGMPVYNAQNWANNINHRNLLAHISLGAIGYNVYPLSFARYYPEPQNGTLYDRYNPDGDNLENKFSERGTRATDLKAIAKGLNAAYVEAARTPREQFLVFGMDNRLETNETQQVYSGDGLFVSADLPEDALAFVISNNDYVYIYSTLAGTFIFDRAVFVTASEGYFDETGEWNGDSMLLQYNNLGLDVAAKTLYRIKVQSIENLPSNIPQEYVSAYDAIRE